MLFISVRMNWVNSQHQYLKQPPKNSNGQLAITNKGKFQEDICYCLVKNRNANSSSSKKSVIEQEAITVSRNEPCKSVFHKDDIDKLIKLHLITQLEEVNHLTSILLTISMSCQQKQKLIKYLMKAKLLTLC